MSNTKTLFIQHEAADYLSENGFRIHVSDLSRMGKYGQGPKFEKLGRQNVYHKKDLDQFLEENAREANDDSSSDAV